MHITQEALAALAFCKNGAGGIRFFLRTQMRGTCPWSNFNETEKTLGCFSNEKRFEKATANLGRTQALQRELLKVAGWPDCRAAYQENLREAEEWEEYCQELVDHPDRGHSGTGSDLLRAAASWGRRRLRSPIADDCLPNSMRRPKHERRSEAARLRNAGRSAQSYSRA